MGCNYSSMSWSQVLALVFHEKGCQLPALSQCWEIIRKSKYSFTFPKINAAYQALRCPRVHPLLLPDPTDLGWSVGVDLVASILFALYYDNNRDAAPLIVSPTDTREIGCREAICWWSHLIHSEEQLLWDWFTILGEISYCLWLHCYVDCQLGETGQLHILI